MSCHQRISTSEMLSQADLPTLGGAGSDIGITPTLCGFKPRRLPMCVFTTVARACAHMNRSLGEPCVAYPSTTFGLFGGYGTRAPPASSICR
jgi:hypothetical protein